jgi:sRNA-binding carbon storage regulator CsrA
MLCLTRKPGQTLIIRHKGEMLELQILFRGRRQQPIMLGITAPPSFQVVREELIQRAESGALRKLED